jgi:hypothetical protein
LNRKEFGNSKIGYTSNVKSCPSIKIIGIISTEIGKVNPALTPKVTSYALALNNPKTAKAAITIRFFIF